jgi:hypothetical protein
VPAAALLPGNQMELAVLGAGYKVHEIGRDFGDSAEVVTGPKAPAGPLTRTFVEL